MSYQTKNGNYTPYQQQQHLGDEKEDEDERKTKRRNKSDTDDKRSEPEGSYETDDIADS